MKKILVIGATGQIGSALMTKLRKEYGNDNVVAGYIEGVPLSDELKNGGPLEIADVTNAQQIAAIIDKYKIDSIYNLSRWRRSSARCASRERCGSGWSTRATA